MKYTYSTEEVERTFELTFDFKKMQSVTIALPSSWESYLIKDD